MAIMQMLRKNPVNTRGVEKKTKIFNTAIRLFFKVLSCDMVESEIKRNIFLPGRVKIDFKYTQDYN